MRGLLILWTALLVAGCATSRGGDPSTGSAVTFDPIPPQSVQTQSLREVRFRRFASADGFTSSEWTGEPSIWPVEHPEREVISRYGPRGRSRKLHQGIDIKAPEGTAVVATANGEVTYAGRRSGYGNYVEINHGDGVTTAYGHFADIFVTVGDVVFQGMPVGSVGDTGNASTPHVHYEVRIDAQAFDPWLFLPAVAP